MPNYRIIYSILPATILFFSAVGCGWLGGKTCGGGVKSVLLMSMINASDDSALDQFLTTHGSITEDELPCIVEATESWSSTKRRNGAQLLVLVGGDPEVVLAAKEKVVLETDDVFVWAKTMDSLMDSRADSNPVELAAKRHDMIKKALSDDDGFIQSVGLKVGVIGTYPNIETEIGKRLESDDAKLLGVILKSLTPDMARMHLPRLLKMLEDYESEEKYTNYLFPIYFFYPLLDAIIVTDDASAYLSVRAALERVYKDRGRFGGGREDSNGFHNTAVFSKADPWMKFCFYLINENSVLKPTAIGILTSRVELGKQEPMAEIVDICIETIENGNLDNKDWRNHSNDAREQHDCEMFFKFLETGVDTNVGEGKRKLGKDAVEFGRKWLRENGETNSKPSGKK